MMIAITVCTLIAPQLVDQETSAVMIIRGTWFRQGREGLVQLTWCHLMWVY